MPFVSNYIDMKGGEQHGGSEGPSHDSGESPATAFHAAKDAGAVDRAEPAEG